MKPKRLRRRIVGITLKTALLSWLVTLTTLLIFVTVIIPEQKLTFLENLTSKAQGVAVSLRDMATAPVINGDYDVVWEHCNNLIRGDKAIDYLLLTKNDGSMALIHDRSGWRMADALDAYWRPAGVPREPSGGIGVVPLFNRRVFHYSHPFDYERGTIQWGWIHVGLSLDTYDRSVARVYRRTSLLAILCVTLSLAASLAYARRLVRPILNLRAVVQRVAGGDLSARASISGGDELGNLAASVNTMTEALLRRDEILQSVRFAAQQFLGNADWRQALPAVLAKLGAAAEVSRVRVLENREDEKRGLVACQTCEWIDGDWRPTTGATHWRELDTRGAGLDSWIAAFKRGESVSAHTRELDPAQKAVVEPGGTRSFITIPIMVENSWWGVLSLVDCQSERDWTDGERDSIRAAADMLGAAIARKHTQDALIEAKETLEERVRARTRELQEQVAAKERARADLADAQQRLMETSRQAGMAEVATGVLHNVGNVLNSVNVSTTLVYDRVRQSRIASLVKAGQLLREHAVDLGDYIVRDPRGQRLPSFLIHLADHLEGEQQATLREMESLVKNVEHIKEIVAMQLSYAKVSGVLEALPVVQVVEDALQMNAAALRRHQIEVVREFQEVPLVTCDKHKVLQILVNLIRNAKFAVEEKAGLEAKWVRVSIGPCGGNRVRIAVADNGIGIPPENLDRIFAHGFTTKKNGHGFGLHMGALAAKEMGGSLKVHSEGPGRGAVFVLELPTANVEV